MNKKKVLIVSLIVLLIAVLAGAGIWFLQRNKKSNVVEVYPMDYLNSADYVDYGSELTGLISSDYVQEVVADGSKDIKKIYVKKGQQVKKGDKILKYNVDEQELDVKLQKLQIQSARLQIANMEKELEKLKNTKPVGAVDGSGTPLLQASLSLPGLKDMAFRAVLTGNNGLAGTYVAQEDENSEGQQDGSGGDISQQDGVSSGTDSGASSETDSGASSGTDNTSSGTDSGDTPAKDSKAASKTDGGASSGTDSGDTPAKNSKAASKTGDGDNGETTEDPLKAAKEKAKEAIEGYKSDSYTYDVDETLENKVISEYCGENGKIDSGKIDSASTEDEVNSLRGEAVDKLKEIAGLAAKRDAAKKEIDTYVFDKKYGKADEEKKDSIIEAAEKNIDSATSADAITEAMKDALAKLKELQGGPLYTHIDDADGQQSSNSGNGKSAQNTIRYLLVKDGSKQPTIAGEVVNTFFTVEGYAGRYIEFRVYDSESDYPKGSPSLVFQMTPDSELKGSINKNKNYTVPELQKLIRQKTTPQKTQYLLKSLNNYTQHQSGKGTLKSKYKYNLKKNALIKGSVINSLISKKKYAVLRDYESEDAYAAGDNPLNTITITPDTVFSEKISGTAKYTVRDLNKLLVSVQSITVTPKKKGLKTVQAGNKYKFSAKASGSNTGSLGVSWSVSNAKSKATKISSDGVLTVGADETAAALKVTAAMGTKKGSYLVKVKKESSGGGSSGGYDGIDIGDDDDGGSSGGDSGEKDTYTAQELKEAIAEKEQDIAEAKQDLNEAKINYREAKREVDAAVVKAVVSGKVTVAYTASDAPTDSAAVIVRADDGVYVKSAVSELNLDTVKVGGKITCTSYETNEQYEAEVREVSDFPTDSYQSDSSGNPNNSYYPMMAYIESADGLTIGETVTIGYDSYSMGTTTGDSIYLPMAYVRTEGKKSYVYKADKDGRLKKSYIKTGSSVSGQFIEVTAGLTLDDMLAFPYGKKVKDGAKTKVSDNPDDIVY